MRILVVDDDPVTAESIVDLLRMYKCDAEGAYSGAEALKRLAVTPPFDVIMVDWLMPLMSGREFLTQLHAEPRWGGIPVVIMTALSDGGVEWDFGPRDRLLRKPFEPAELVPLLEGLVQKPA